MDVQNAIENVQAQLARTALGELPDGSVTGTKLAEGSISGDKLAINAVTAEKLAAGVIPSASKTFPLMSGEAAIGAEVGFARGDHVHPSDSRKADLQHGKVLPNQLSRSRVTVTGDRALELGDDGKALYVSSISELTLTVPMNSAVQLPIGCEILIYRGGSGAVAIVPAQGVTLLSSETAQNPLRRYDSARLKKWEANLWSVEYNHFFRPGHGDIDSDSLAASAVTGEKLADGAVTRDKLAAGATHRVLTLTLAPDDWTDNEQTVSATGIDGDSTLIVSPAPESYPAYCEAGVRAVMQGTDSLSFVCDSVPNTELAVLVGVLT